MPSKCFKSLRVESGGFFFAQEFCAQRILGVIMPPLVNRRWESFCIEYFGGKNQAQAAIAAGYSAKTAYAIASRLLKNVKISDRLRELQEEVASAKIMSVRERKERLSEVARARITDFVEAGADGAWVNIGLESANSAALQEVKSKTEYDGDGARAAVITNVKLHDPIKAIGELNKMEGSYAPTEMRHTGETGGPIQVEVDVKSKLISILNRLAARQREAEDDKQPEP